MTVGSPALVDWNVTSKEALCPAAKVNGTAMPVTWNPEPAPRIALMVTEEAVLLVIVSGIDLVLPTGTEPKLRLPLPSPTVPAPVEPPVSAWHPVSSNRPPVITREMTKR